MPETRPALRRYVQALEAENDRLRADRDEARKNYDGACVTIALMHEAATGRKGEGPRRGVVEDVADAVREAEERGLAWADNYHGREEDTALAAWRQTQEDRG